MILFTTSCSYFCCVGVDDDDVMCFVDVFAVVVA